MPSPLPPPASGSDWYRAARGAYWLISALFSPINTGLRYLASEVGAGRPLQMLQENLILWFYTAYVHRLGTYLIDVNSGRLRVGAERYRELLRQQEARRAVTAQRLEDEVASGRCVSRNLKSRSDLEQSDNYRSTTEALFVTFRERQREILQSHHPFLPRARLPPCLPRLVLHFLRSLGPLGPRL